MAVITAVSAQQNNSETYRQLNLFGDIFERVQTDYVEEVSEEKLIEAAINGMLTSLDPHSGYLNQKNYRDMQIRTRGEFGGLGIEVTMENGLVKVVSPIDDTPAYRAHLKPGDLITHLDGEPIQGLSLSEAVEKMRGKVGSNLTLTIRRGGTKPFNVTLTRAIIKIRSVRSRMEGNDVAYIRITTFSEKTEKGVKNALKLLRKTATKKLKGLVLDLRNNPGGLLDQSVKISDAFLSQGEIVSTRSRRPQAGQRFNAKPGDIADGLPIVVLVNGGSASASEIVAGALQDHRRALILGTRSFGKGSVQTIVPLSGHGAIRLTTARYFTPSGRSIQAKGIVPDIIVEQLKLEKVDQPNRPREEDLRGRLDNPNKPGTADKKNTPQSVSQDYQLSRALDLLRGIALYGSRDRH
ncbi:MAG: S41 family peptidase [Pseudomonadota bacterium]|nr:S41 family peptidase [Pseudomonadota bacterium]